MVVIVYAHPDHTGCRFRHLHCIQGLKCTGSQRVEDPALSNVPGIFVYSFTVSPVAVIEPDIEICGLNNETTERRRTAGSSGLCHSK